MSAVVLLLACLVAASCYSGAITTAALVIFVLPCLVITVLAAFRFRSATLPALVTVGLVALGSSEIVNLVSGTDYGPAARSSFGAAASSGAVIVLAASAVPVLLLAPLTASIAWALALGAAQEVRGPAVAAAVLALVALALVERGRRRPVGLPFDVVGIAAPLVLSAVLGVLLVNLQNDRFDKDPYLPFPDSVRAEIKPFTAPSPTPSPTVSPTPTGTPSPTPTPTSSSADDAAAKHSAPSHVVRNVLVLLLVLLSPVLAWLLARLRSAASWGRAGQRLRQGPGKQVVTGAWVWAAARRASLGDGFDPWQSPDVLLASGALRDDAPWSELASLVSRAAFADADTSDQLGRQAWTAAAEAWHDVRQASPWWRRAWSDLRSARGVKTTG